MSYYSCTHDVNNIECGVGCCSATGICQLFDFGCKSLSGAVNSAVNLGIGLIVGIAVAGVVFVVILAVSIYCCVKRCRAKNVILTHGNTTTFVPMSPMPMQPNMNMNMNMGMNNAMGAPTPPPFLADSYGNKTALLGAQGTPYGNYGNNNL